MEKILKERITAESIDILNMECESARKTNIVLAMEIAERTINDADVIGYMSGLAKAYLNAGICKRLLSEFEAAVGYYTSALNIYKQIGDPKGESRTVNSIANAYLYLGDFSAAINNFDDCIFLLESIGDTEFEAIVLSNRGLAYQQRGDYDSALKNYIQSLSLHISCKKDIPYYL